MRDERSGRVTVTAQNHEVQVVGESLPEGSGFYVSQRNLNDGTVEGLRHHAKPFETVQYHPEGSPGPLDAAEVFDRVLSMPSWLSIEALLLDARLDKYGDYPDFIELAAKHRPAD